MEKSYMVWFKCAACLQESFICSSSLLVNCDECGAVTDKPDSGEWQTLWSNWPVVDE